MLRLRTCLRFIHLEIRSLLFVKPIVTLTPHIYGVTDHLPPIFSSQLCHKTKPIHLTISLPNLSSLIWVRESEEDELIRQTDRQVSGFYFYRDAKNKAAAIPKLYDENAIRDLFEENEDS